MREHHGFGAVWNAMAVQGLVWQGFFNLGE